MAKRKRAVIAVEQIEQSIYLIRGQKVMLDMDLAPMYGVETRSLVQAVKRNRVRFPSDFAYQLTAQELVTLRSQSVISKPDPHTALQYRIGTIKPDPRGGRRYAPYAFTEQGVAMLSSVLRSPRAVQVNIEVMRAFVRLRGMLASNKELSRRLDDLEKTYDKQFAVVFDAIRQLMTPPTPKQKEIGYHTLLDKR